MSEHRTIRIAVYRTPDGAPTCARDFSLGQVCKFWTSHHFGTGDVCHLAGQDIARGDYGKGWLQPVAECLVWAIEGDE